MTSPDAGVPHGRDPERGRFVTWMTAAFCVAAMVWMCLGGRLLSRETYAGRKADYYNREVHGFLKGHLYLDTPADPGRDAKEPAAPSQSEYALDASLYKGRIYLYFGVVPAALVLLPYTWLTGGDLDPRVIVAFAASIGFLFSVGILQLAAREFPRRLGLGFKATAVALLAFASAVPSLLTRSMFYEVAIASGYAFTMAGLFWTVRALFGRKGSWLPLALASASFGLAVGCRPTLVMNLPVVAGSALLVAWREREKSSLARRALYLAAASVPAAAIGLALGAFNYERFGSPLEFGVNYCMNFFIGNGKALFSTAYVWPNLHWYYLTPPSLSPYFPFVFPEAAYFGPPEYRWGEVIHGQFPVFALAVFAGVSGLFCMKRMRLGSLAPLLSMSAWMFLLPMIPVIAIGFRGDRYMVDFQPALILGILVVAGMIASLPEGGGRMRWWEWGFAVLSLLAVAFNFFGGLQQFDTFRNTRPDTFRQWARLGNMPAHWLGKAGLLHSGPVEVKVVFPTQVSAAAVEPLVVAGTPEYTDALYVVEWPPGDTIEFQADHSGYGGPHSDVIHITPGKAYTITLDMGSLYPPLSAPFIADYKKSQTRILKTRIEVAMDGKPVLNAMMGAYDAPPWSLEIGKNDITMNPFKTRFSGRVLSTALLASPTLMEQENNGLWRFYSVFPVDRPNVSFPILSSGLAGSGSLVYLKVLPGNRVQFAFDEWGYGGGMSDPISVEPQSDHVVELLIGPLATKVHWPEAWGRLPARLAGHSHDLSIWLDGRLVWTAAYRHPVDPSNNLFDVGANRQGFSTAQAEYVGPIQSAPYTAAEARDFLERNAQGIP